MKPRTTLTLSTLTLSFLLLGCKTLGPTLVSTAAAIGGQASEWAVRQYPQHRAAFAVAEKSLSGLIDTGTYDPVIFAAVLDDLPIDALGGPTGDLYIQGMVLVFDVIRGLSYEVTSKPAVKQVMTSIRDGFKRGLANATMTAAVSTRLRGAAGPVEGKVLYPPRSHQGVPIRKI